MSAVERAPSRTRGLDAPRQPDYVVRAKVGQGHKDWATIGYAWKREGGEGISIKLNTMPIGNFWDGKLKLLPPFEEDNPESEAP